MFVYNFIQRNGWNDTEFYAVSLNPASIPLQFGSEHVHEGLLNTGNCGFLMFGLTRPNVLDKSASQGSSGSDIKTSMWMSLVRKLHMIMHFNYDEVMMRWTSELQQYIITENQILGMYLKGQGNYTAQYLWAGSSLAGWLTCWFECLCSWLAPV